MIAAPPPLCLRSPHPALLYAQDVVLMVTVPSADVYKAPTNVTPVIGHVSQGTVLPIERNLGSWVKIPWPGGQDGFGYVHVSNGPIGPLKAEARAAASASPLPPRTTLMVVPITQTPRSPALSLRRGRAATGRLLASRETCRPPATCSASVGWSATPARWVSRREHGAAITSAFSSR